MAGPWPPIAEEPELDRYAGRVTSTPVGPKAEQTRKSILDAAIARFGSDGYQRSSVAAIARDAGVSRSLAYAYFEDREALFEAALDHDAAAVINEGVAGLAEPWAEAPSDTWPDELFITLLGALEHHPLARRVLAGLEPEVTRQVLGLSALEDLRAAVGQRLADGQAAGMIRTDIDPISVGRGAVNLWIGQLMAVVQFGWEGLAKELPHSRALFIAALAPPAD